MSGRQQKVMLQPINVIFRHLQQQTRVSLWLYDNVESVSYTHLTLPTIYSV